MPLARNPALVAMAASLALAACGGGSGDTQQAPSFEVQGVDVVLRTTAPFTKVPDFPSRIESTIDSALRYWGGSWADLQGVRITLVDDAYVDCSGMEALGCYDGNIRLTTRDPGIGTFACVEETVLVHEIGHAVIDDRNHTDPRWMEMDSVATELDGRTGYTATGDTACTTYVSVWRHPIGSP